MLHFFVRLSHLRLGLSQNIAVLHELCFTLPSDVNDGVAVVGPAGPSHTHPPAGGRGAKSRVQAVAVREHTTLSQPSYADVERTKALSGFDLTHDRPQNWQYEGYILEPALVCCSCSYMTHTSFDLQGLMVT